MSHSGQPPADLVRVQLLVEKSTKRALYMEAGKDFVDLLFSFLMLPTGTVIKLISQDMNLQSNWLQPRWYAVLWICFRNHLRPCTCTHDEFVPALTLEP
jgi:hypothetical protein